MTRRLFDDDEHAVKLLNTERRQALFQIFYTCCNAEERNCGKCFFFESR